MLEKYEFRLYAKYGHLIEDLLPERPMPSNGAVILRGTVGDPVFLRVGELDQKNRQEGRGGIFAGWDICRSFSNEEMERAELFLLRIPFTHLAGEEFGTKYLESSDCWQEAYNIEVDERSRPHLVPEKVPCGVCAKQESTLSIPFNKLDRKSDLYRLWGGELVLSEALAALILDGSFVGGELRPVEEFRPTDTEEEDRKGATSRRNISQLVINSEPLEISKYCRFGDNPFDTSESSIRCKTGEIAGNALISPLSILGASWHGADICRTRVYIGRRQGLFRPHQLFVISRRLFYSMREKDMKGFNWEVVEII